MRLCAHLWPGDSDCMSGMLALLPAGLQLPSPHIGFVGALTACTQTTTSYRNLLI